MCGVGMVRGKLAIAVTFGPPDYFWTCLTCHRIYRIFAEAYDCAKGCTKTPLTPKQRKAQYRNVGIDKIAC